MGINPKDYIPSPRYCSLRSLVLGAGMLSSLLNLLLMIISMVVLVMDNTWHLVMDMAEPWLQENHWDIKVSIDKCLALILLQIIFSVFEFWLFTPHKTLEEKKM